MSKPKAVGIYVEPSPSHRIFVDLLVNCHAVGRTGGRNWVMNYKKSSRDFQNTGLGQLRDRGWSLLWVDQWRRGSGGFLEILLILRR